MREAHAAEVGIDLPRVQSPQGPPREEVAVALYPIWKRLNGSFYPVKVIPCPGVGLARCGVEIDAADELCEGCRVKRDGPPPARISYCNLSHE